jgi:hypothetical protein
MILSTAAILLYLVALFLTAATLWLFLHAAQTISPNDPEIFWVFIFVVIPFVMLVYFGLAFIIDDTISLGATSLTPKENELSFAESLFAAVSYVGLSGWVWLRWRNSARR